MCWVFPLFAQNLSTTCSKILNDKEFLITCSNTLCKSHTSAHLILYTLMQHKFAFTCTACWILKGNSRHQICCEYYIVIG